MRQSRFALQAPRRREEVTRMRKVAVTTLIACMLALVFASASGVSATPSDPDGFTCEMAASFDLAVPGAHWEGTVTGCKIQGTIEVFELPASFVGNTEHFFETYTITTSTGVISGVDQGVWGFNTFKFRANGWITEATGDWSYLSGYKLHESGYTSAVPPAEGSIVTLTGTMFFVEP